MDKIAYQKLLDLIRQRQVFIEVYHVKNPSLFKKIWLWFAYTYIRFRAVRDLDFFQQAYQSEIIRLRLEKGTAIAHPSPWHTAFETALKE